MSSGMVLSDARPTYEVAIIGAGPAGMSAAVELGAIGVSAIVIDDQPTPGGQIYRSISRSPLVKGMVLGADYWAGAMLVDRFENSELDYLPDATVWQIEAEDTAHTLYVSSGGLSRRIEASFVIIATGAMERPFPVAGWTRPGVLGIGAAQILLKSSGALPAGQTVLLGAGPLLWLYAGQMTDGGRPPSHILSTASSTLPLLPGAWADFMRSSYASKGAALLWKVRRASTYARVREPRIEARDDRLAVRYRTGVGNERELLADTVLVHQGVVPNLNLPRSANCDIQWNGNMACWQPKTDQWGTSSVPKIAIAGDAAGILGAESSAKLGRIAALNAACSLGRISEERREELARDGFAFLSRDRKARRLLDLLYRPSVAMRTGGEDALVCRCEEVRGSELRTVIRETQAQGPNQIKSHIRCGMGPCQGRYCSLTVNEIIAQERNVPPGAIMPMRIRPPVKPVTLQELASLEEQQ